MRTRELLTTIEIGGAIALALGAFSSGVRREILRRDGGCVVCGATDNLEASHYDHNRKSRNYNDPSNGEMRCTLHHLDQHIEMEGNNGLTIEGNRWAIKKLQERLRGV